MSRSHVALHWGRIVHLLPMAAAVVVVLALAVPGLAGNAKRGYPAPSGRIHFRTTVTADRPTTEPLLVLREGTSVVTWSDYGRKWRKDVSERVSAGQSKTPAWTICDGKHVYQADPKRPKHAVRMGLAQAERSGITPFIVVSDTVRTETGKPGTEKVLGKPCGIYRFGPSTYWEWQGTNTVLRYQFIMTESPLERMVATKVELNAKVAPAQFRAPAGCRVKDK